MNTSTPVLVHPAHQHPAMTEADLRRCAPSVYATNARPGVSHRYSFISTIEVIDLLRSEGWEPVRAREQRVRLEERQGFQMHEIRFARKAELGIVNFEVGHTRPELILQNAHDGTRAYRIDAGLYRLVCRNGLTVADATFAKVSIRHVDVAEERFVEAARSVAANTPRVLETVSRWKEVKLSEPTRVKFARQAAALRWDETYPGDPVFTPEKLLRPVRHADTGNDLWTTFNVLQEHIVRGGDSYTRYVPNFETGARGPHVVRGKTRTITGIHESKRINKALWSLADQFSQN